MEARVLNKYARKDGQLFQCHKHVPRCHTCRNTMNGRVRGLGFYVFVYACSHLVYKSFVGAGKGSVHFRNFVCLKCRAFPCGQRVDSDKNYVDLAFQHGETCETCRAKKTRDPEHWWDEALQIRESYKNTLLTPEDEVLLVPDCKFPQETLACPEVPGKNQETQ